MSRDDASVDQHSSSAAKIAVSAFAGYERAVFPFPSNLVAKGFIAVDIEEVIPQLSVHYLLLDFGGRGIELLPSNDWMAERTSC